MPMGGGATEPRTGPWPVRQAVEIILVVLLAAQAAKLIWTLITPLGPFGAPVLPRVAPPARPDFSALDRFNPFFRDGVAGAGAAAASDASLQGLRLHGVRGPMFGDRGSAIIATADGKQASYQVGDVVAPGVTLAGVGGDSVVLRQNGSDLRLTLAEYGAASAPAPPLAETPPAGLRLPPPPASAPSSPAAAIDAGRFLAQAGLQPRRQGGRINGYTLSARGREDMLLQAGLRPGDVILAVDGRTLDSPERLGDMATEMQKNPEADIQFERGGQVMSTRVRTGR